jgi:hypothetical protein
VAVALLINICILVVVMRNIINARLSDATMDSATRQRIRRG